MTDEQRRQAVIDRLVSDMRGVVAVDRAVKDGLLGPLRASMPEAELRRLYSMWQLACSGAGESHGQRRLR